MKLETQSVREILARLDAARAAIATSDVLLAFDADGTLWSGDVGLDMFEALLRSRDVRPEAHAALEAEAALAGVDERGDPVVVARALYAAYEAGRYSEERVFSMMAWIFAGWTHDEVSDFSEQVLRDTGISERIRPEIPAVLDWARHHDVDVYVISASPRFLIRRAVAPLGVPEERVAAMTPSVREGRLEARLEGPAVYGEGKLVALRRARPDAVILGGFGDSGYDAAFLREARVPVAVRPTASLLSCAASLSDLVEMKG